MASWPKPRKGTWQWSTQQARASCGKSCAWRGFKICRSLATCTKSRRESAKWTSPALPGRDSGLPDGQVPGSAVLLQLFGQILRQAWFWADSDGHWEFAFCVIMWFVERSSAPRVAGGIPKMEKKEWFAWTKWIEREPGMFKLEFEGTSMISLSSKCYYGEDEKGKIKASSKAMQKRQNKLH